jgi:hypothetical protein
VHGRLRSNPDLLSIRSRFDTTATLLLDLIHLLGSVFLALVPVAQQDVEGIMCNLELSADEGLSGLDDALAVCLGVLVLVGAGEVRVRGEGHVPELRCVLLYDGEAGLDLGQARVAELIGLVQVGCNIREGGLEVGVEGSKNALVCVVEDGKRLCAVGVRLVELDRVVDDGVCLEMLFQVWSGVARVMAGGGAGLTDKTLDCGVSPFVSGASPLLMVPLVVVVVSSACGDMRV